MRRNDTGGSGVFISYSHRDSEWLDRLRVHLRPLEREYGIDFWDDTRITSGSKWKKEIENALQVCRIAILLISADFLASEFVANDELPPLLIAAADNDTTILPLILSPSRFLRTRSLSQFQAVNDPMKPLIGLTRAEQEDILDRVAQRIEILLAQVPEPAQYTVDDSPGTSRRTSTEDFGQLLDELEQEQQTTFAAGASSRENRPAPQSGAANVDTSDEVYKRLRAIIVDELGVADSEVVPGATVIGDLGADSLDGVELVMYAEEAFGIEITDEEAANISTVGDAYLCVKSKLQ